jgi:hypothetical protein
VEDIAPRHLRPGAEHDAYGGPLTPPRRRATDRAGVSGENGSAMVLGMTRDELFDAFSKFVSARVESKGRPPAADAAQGADPDVDGSDGGAEGKVIADHPQPAQAHAKAKAVKKKR